MKLKSRSKSSRGKKRSSRGRKKTARKTKRSRPRKVRPRKAKKTKKTSRKTKIKKRTPGKKKKLLGKVRRPGKKTRLTTRAKARIKAKPRKKPKKSLRPRKVEKPKIDELELEKAKLLHGLLSDSTVRQLLIDIGGENALAIIRNFQGKLSDEDLSKTLELKISDVRATLNRLHNEGFVKYIRQKDSETGWYSYSWVLNYERLEKWAREQANGIITLEGNGNQYYFCKACGVTTLTDFITASDLGFRCERCNKSLEFLDDKAVENFNISFKETPRIII